MIALLIWLGWIGFSVAIYFVIPHIPFPKHFVLGSNKILRIQTALFVAGWVGKFFAGGLYFAAGHRHAIALACCALVALFTVFILGCVFRKFPSKTEQIETLKKQLAALGVDTSGPADQNTHSHTLPPPEAMDHQASATLSFSELESRIRARRGV